jgi:hypothetical protein
MKVLPVAIALLFVLGVLGLGVAAIWYGAADDSPGLVVVGIALVAGMLLGALLAWRRVRQLR